MINSIYSLPKLDFVGGESQTFLFHLLSLEGHGYDANGCDIAFSIINYQNKNGDPLLVKDTTLQIGDDGVPNIVTVYLLPEDTVDMYGRYVYQLSIRDSNDETEIPGQGVLDITHNIHRSFITQ